jgi:dTDP-L-rhamnose 4-epimerase
VEHVLITGGAGFIGSHVADRLLEAGVRVRVFDALHEQVHGEAARPPYLAEDIELVRGDIRDPVAVEQALEGVDAVVHLAARVGTGQSMYEIAGYVDVNVRGTAVLLEALAKRPVGRLVVASSMSLYGEGAYITEDGEPCEAVRRTREQLERREWEPVSEAGERLLPVPTPETKTPDLSSVYALTKYDQERLCLMFGSAYQVSTVALRLFNVYGPRQAVSNPYTGVLAIFASRLLNDRQPIVFEDGLQQRDFVSVYDVAGAVVLALGRDGIGDEVLNIGSGLGTSVFEIGERLASVVGKPFELELPGTARIGDIRHCFANIDRARETLGYEPHVTFEEGFRDLAEWLAGQRPEDRVEEAVEGLVSRGLTV